MGSSGPTIISNSICKKENKVTQLYLPNHSFSKYSLRYQISSIKGLI